MNTNYRGEPTMLRKIAVPALTAAACLGIVGGVYAATFGQAQTGTEQVRFVEPAAEVVEVTPTEEPAPTVTAAPSPSTVAPAPKKVAPAPAPVASEEAPAPAPAPRQEAIVSESTPEPQPASAIPPKKDVETSNDEQGTRNLTTAQPVPPKK